MSIQSSPSGPSDRARAEAFVIAMPRRRLTTWLAPLGATLIVAFLLVISARDVLTPTTPVRISPVIPVREVAPTPDPSRAVSSDRPRSTMTVQAPGWLEADPYYIACTALADGVVDEMLVLEGERVEKDQIVARLVEDDARIALASAEAQLAAAEADLLVAQADLAAAQSNWEHPIERQRAVDASRAALAEVEAELLQLPALIAEDQADLDRMEEEWRRGNDAFQSGAASDIEVIILRKRADSQAAQLSATRRREAILSAMRDRLRAELTAAQRNFDLRIEERRALDAAQAEVARAQAAVMSAQASRDDAQLRLDRMTIRAPITGFVQRRLKVPGDKVMLGMDDPHSSHVLHLYDPSMIQVRVDVPLADAAHVFLDQRCEVIVDVLPDDTFEGVVTRITHEADLQKNTLQIKVRVLDPSPLLRPEMLTRVKFLPDGPAGQSSSSSKGEPSAAAEIVVVSEQSLLDRTADRARVLVIRQRRGDKGVIQSVTVDIAGVEDGWARVRGSIKPGDLLAVEPIDLAEGDRVKVIDRVGGAS